MIRQLHFLSKARIQPTPAILFMALWVASFVPLASAEPATLTWISDHEQCLKEGAAQEKAIIIDMWAPWCVPCKQLEKETLHDPKVEAVLKDFVRCKLNMDAEENEKLWTDYKVDNLPRVLFLRSDGSVVPEVTLKEFEKTEPFLSRLNKARQLLNTPGTEKEEAKLPATAPSAKDAPEGSKAEKPRVVAQLIADSDTYIPGETFRAGVHFTLDPEWHIYWHYSGQAGLPTKVSWVLPETIQAGALQWPAPAQFKEKMDDETLTTVGYADESLLFSEISIPSGFSEGQSLDIVSNVQWLVCRESCIRGSAKLKLTLPRGESAAPNNSSLLPKSCRNESHSSACCSNKSLLMSPSSP